MRTARTFTAASLSVLLTGVVLASAPMGSLAAKPAPAFNNCVKAFLAQVSGASSDTVQLREAHYLGGGAIEHAKDLDLTAWDARTSEPIARATCTYDARGEVVRIRAESEIGRAHV